MNRLLIDGDVVLYQVTQACETAVDWGDDMWTLHSDFKEAKQRWDCWIADIMERLNGDKCEIAFSGTDNWRKTVLPTYKSHRKSNRKPLVFNELKNYVHDTYKTHMADILEGDDVLGIMMGDSKLSGDKICVTIDKDLKTIEGLHYNPMKKDEGVFEVSEEQADYNHLYQALMGDAVDGYAGCPGIGPKTASRLLDDKGATWDTVVEAYNKKGIEEEDALVQARVARILRFGEYDRKNEEVILWLP